MKSVLNGHHIYKMLLKIFLLSMVSLVISQERTITFNNRCANSVWISFLTNDDPQLDDGIQHLDQNTRKTFKISNSGWRGRFWPKTGCDASGDNCNVGQSMTPCPSSGCQPPAYTKVEFYFPSISNRNNIWYEFSLIDGYSLPMEIIPNKQGGSCAKTNCSISLSVCPTNEKLVGDLRVVRNGSVVQCLAPCKKWNFPIPYGLGNSNEEPTGQQLCCPSPLVSPEQCRGSEVVSTQYVRIVKRDCPTAYSYEYDDDAGLHNCPNPTNFDVNVC